MPSMLQFRSQATPPIARCSGTLASALAELAELQFRLGDWAAAHASMADALRAARASGLDDEVGRALAGLAHVDAGRGRADDCRTHANEAIRLSHCRGGSQVEAMAGQAIGFLELGLGRMAAAIERLESVALILQEHPDASALAATCALDLAEARLLRGDRRGARRALDGAEQQQRRAGSWALTSASARLRAMLASDDASEALFRLALAWTARAQQPFEEARTELCFGHRLRTVRRRREARAHLRAALRTFAALDARPWADRARRELAAA